MYHILLPVDANAARVDAQVAAILDLPADPDDLAVAVLYVHETQLPDTEWLAGGFADELEDIDSIPPDATVPETVESATTQLADAGIEVTQHETAGDPAEAILGMADELDSDTIYIGARRRSPIGKVIFGNVAQGVILDSDRPVTVISTE